MLKAEGQVITLPKRLEQDPASPESMEPEQTIAVDMSAAFREHSAREALEPREGAYEALQQLKQQYQIGLLAVGERDTSQITNQVIEEYFPDTFYDYRFLRAEDEPDAPLPSKEEACRDTGAEWLIDKDPRYARLMAEMGKKALLFGDHAGSRAEEELPEEVTRVKDWQGVLDYFYGEDRG